ncbi:MAG: tRNA (N(6)-L-threonylcarbamoyladenosine(37)-C(2))-methylthiotransferase MtaB [Rickettsiaceae bacterium]|jgi:threonylcarbamoyladenosine tRNA methylthiotransferase MtaB|nr:tRNA (N(6)-L-threonylcarbamoyladenosine(37)-C(2))-methylthiotransferase MtaB [Rickettsiaceae bacterium]
MNETHEVITFGCRLNTYESEIIKENLVKSGIQNVAVFNTCAVTKEAEKQARQAIRKLKKQDPTKKIIVTGCAAQNTPQMFANMPEVDKVIGNEEKLSPLHYTLDTERVIVNDIMSIKETANHLVRSFEGKARAFIQVQNGCDHRCTFCMIPFGRGNSRSVPIGVIVQQVRALTEEGFKEIVLTGVDVTAYGGDLPGMPTFAQMIKRLLSLVPELYRLRLSSIDVAEIDDDLFNLMAYEKRLMPHFHISLQAGDNMILKRMKRRHNREQVIKFCKSLRVIRPEVSFGADIIAGFPTETDEMFENTRSLISEANIQYLHVFPYSEREGTPASKMPQVPLHIRKKRASILREEGQKEIEKFFKYNLGKKTTLLVEKNNMAHAENFIPVKLDGEFSSGQLIDVQLTEFNDKHMLAKVA